MTRLLVSLCLAGLPAVAAESGVSGLLKELETRYNRARTVQVLFEQTYTGMGRPRQVERGELFLRKPGRMRWQYSTPAGKLFVSDNKMFYVYTPSANRVQQGKVKESDDLRAPLGFLLGKLDFWRDFEKFVSRPEGADVRITATPRSERSPYAEVEFVVTPSHEIRYLKILGQDQSVMEFRFSRERLDLPLQESLFRFVPPPGVEIVNAIEEMEGTP